MPITKNLKHLADGRLDGKPMRAIYLGAKRIWPAIELIGTNSSATTTVTIPPHRAGDLLVIAAFWPVNASSRTVPAGWSSTIAPAGVASTGYFAVAERLATTSTTTSGTWTGASRLMVLVYRGARTIGNWVWARRTDELNITSPGPDALHCTDGTSRIVRGVFSPSALPDIAVPAGYASRIAATNGVIVDTNATTAAAHPSLVIGTPSSTITWHAFSLEVIAHIEWVWDDFDRTSSNSSLGAGWIPKNSTMGIYQNAAFPDSATYCNAMCPQPLSSDDMEVSIVVGIFRGDAETSGRPSYAILGANDQTGAAAWLRVARNSANVSIHTVTSWAGGNITSQISIPHGGFDTGDRFTLRRVGNRYTVLKNGNQIGQPWIDSTNILPRNKNHRFVGVGGWGGHGPSDFGMRNPYYQCIDSWYARSLVPTAQIADDFLRADSTTTAGGQWVTRAGTMGINNSAAYPIGGRWSSAMYAAPMSSDDMEVSLVLGAAIGDAATAGRPTSLILGASPAGESVWADLHPSGEVVYLRTASEWERPSVTTWLSVPHGGLLQGDRWALRRTGSLHTILKNGSVFGEWADSGNEVPRDKDHRFVGIGGWGGTTTNNFRRINSFTARTLSPAGVPEQAPVDAISDDFNRSDLLALRGNWQLKSGAMGIRSGAAYPYLASVCSAMYLAPLTSDDMEVSVVIGDIVGSAVDGGRPLWAILGANKDGLAAWARIDVGNPDIILYTYTDWARTGQTTRVTIPHGGMSTGDTITLRRTGNVYVILKNDDEVGAWVDSGNALPRTEDHRFVGLGGWGGTSTHHMADRFSARVIPAADTPEPVSAIADNFDRPDSVSLGGDWALKSGAIGIRDGAAYPQLTSVCSAMHLAPLTSDDMEVSLVLGAAVGDAATTGRPTSLILGANLAGESVRVDLFPNSGTFTLRTVNDWERASFTDRLVAPHNGMSTGDKWTLRRIDNHYIVLKNGDEIGEWVDEDNVFSRGQDHRFVGFGGWGGGGFDNHRYIDSFSARAVGHEAEHEVFPSADWLWKPIADNPVLDDNSASWASQLATGEHNALMAEFGVTLVGPDRIDESTPRSTVPLDYAGEWGDHPFGDLAVPIPPDTTVASGSDKHVSIIDPVTGLAFGLWGARNEGGQWAAHWGGITPVAGDGIDTAGSSTGSAIARHAGVIRRHEIAAGEIPHALFFSTDMAAAAFRYPAAKSDGSNSFGSPNPIPQGARIQLDPSIDVAAIPGITPGELAIARALQKYGAYCGDNGGSRMAFLFELGDDPSSPAPEYIDAGLEWDYFDLARIPWESLRVLKNWDGSG